MRAEAKTLLRTSALTLVLALLLLPSGAGAVCPNTVETDEQALWNMHACWPAFRDWFRPYFNLQHDHWDEGWGWETCNPTQAFPKMWNSAYLISYGLEDWYLGPWHSDVDYYRWAAGSNHGFRYEPEHAFQYYAQAFWGIFTTDRVEMQCLSFNNYTAGVRAGVMLHESTHIMWEMEHQSNPPGSHCGSTPCSDDWYFHFLNSYPYGSLAGRRHSMIQIQIEYNCDLAEFGEWWVPYTIGIVAQNEANSYMVNRIRNPPGWTCGQPRPLYYTPPPPPSGMQADSAVRGCSNWSWWPPVYQPDPDACYAYCAQNGANACEWYVNGDCYVEFGSGCYVEGGFGGWWAAVF